MHNTLKQTYLSLRVSQCDSFRKQVIQACGWTRDQYYHKFNGRTELTQLEEEKIAEVSTHFKD